MNREVNNLFVNVGEKSQCSICDKEVHAKSYNRKRHLALNHVKIFEEIQTKWKKVEECANITINIPKLKVAYQKWKPEEFENFLVQSVVKSGQSFSHFTKPEFSDFFLETARTVKVSLDANNIKRMVVHRYKKQKSEVIDCIRGRYMFMKIDYTKRNGRYFVGINIQLVNTKMKKIVAYTLGVKQVSSLPTGLAIKEFVMDTLAEFKIGKHQILAITTDNARNLICATNLLSEELLSFEDITEDEDIEVEVELHLSELCSDFVMQHVKCVAHLFQNCVSQAFITSKAEDIIDISKALSIAASSTPLQEVFQSSEYLQSEHIRWINKYNILEQILDAEEHFKTVEIQYPQLHSSEENWQNMKDLKSVLVHVDKFTKKLHEQNLTPGCFFFNWKTLIITLQNCMLNLESVSIAGHFCKCLIENMEKHEDVLFQNRLLAAGIFVEPQYRRTLNDTQLEVAKKGFLNVAVHMEEQRLLQQSPAATEDGQNPQTSSSALMIPTSTTKTTESFFDSEAVLREIMQNQYLKESNKEIDQLKQDLQQYETTILECLDQFHTFPPQTDLMESLWLYPNEARKTALTVAALPTSQVTVKRLFLALKLLYNPSHRGLNPETMKALVFLQCNDC